MGWITKKSQTRPRDKRKAINVIGETDTCKGIWALRALNYAYSGPLITVRRSSDDTELDIAAAVEGIDSASLESFCADLDYTNLVNGKGDSLTDWDTGTGKLTSVGGKFNYNADTVGLKGFYPIDIKAGEKFYVRTLGNVVGGDTTGISFSFRTYLDGAQSDVVGGFTPTDTTLITDSRVVTSTTNVNQFGLRPSGSGATNIYEFYNILYVKMTGTPYEDFTAEQMNAQFPFVDGSGTTTVDGYAVWKDDQSGNGNHATQSTADSQPRIVNAGVIETDSNGDYSIYYDGVDDRMTIADTAGLDINNGGLSLVVKSQIDTPAGNVYVFTRNIDSLATMQYALLASNTGINSSILEGSIRNNDGTATSNVKVSTITYDDANIRIYADASLEATTAFSTTLTSRDNIQIGCRSDNAGGTAGAGFYEGHISDLMVFAKALTQEQITTITNKL